MISILSNFFYSNAWGLLGIVPKIPLTVEEVKKSGLCPESWHQKSIKVEFYHTALSIILAEIHDLQVNDNEGDSLISFFFLLTDVLVWLYVYYQSAV